MEAMTMSTWREKVGFTTIEGSSFGSRSRYWEKFGSLSAKDWKITGIDFSEKRCWKRPSKKTKSERRKIQA